MRIKQSEYQIDALNGLEKALRKQLEEMDNNIEKFNSRVTPYGMEIKLEEIYRESQVAF